MGLTQGHKIVSRKCSPSQLRIGSHKGPVLPQAEKHGHKGVPLFTALSLEYVHVLTHLVYKYLDGVE